MDPPLPSPRNNNFVDRKDIFTQIDETLKQSNIAALVGLGGMGKTQLAIEYAYRHKELYPNSKVIWIRACRQDLILEDFRSIAEIFDISGRHCPAEDVVELVYDWLWYMQHEDWLLVLDDVDENLVVPDIPDSAQMSGRADSPCMSRKSNGKILITSKDRNVAARFTENGNCLVTVDCMTETEATNLLKARLPTAISLNCLGELAQELDYIPMAISQATSYMGTRLSISTYLFMLRASEQLRILLLDYECPNAERELSPSNAILKTLWISFERAVRSGPGVMELLTSFSESSKQSLSRTSEDDDNQAVRILVNFSIVKQDPLVKSGFVMHKVVQLSLREWLKASKEDDSP